MWFPLTLLRLLLPAVRLMIEHKGEGLCCYVYMSSKSHRFIMNFLFFLSFHLYLMIHVISVFYSFAFWLFFLVAFPFYYLLLHMVVCGGILLHFMVTLFSNSFSLHEQPKLVALSKKVAFVNPNAPVYPRLAQGKTWNEVSRYVSSVSFALVNHALCK